MLDTIAVFMGAYAVCMIFALLLRLKVGSFHIQRAVGIASMLAGGATFFPLWRQKRQHRDAVGARYNELLREAKATKQRY